MVERDRDYLAGWAAIQMCAASVAVPAAERELAAAELLRIDPHSRASIPDLAAFTDLRCLWTAVETPEAVGGPFERRPIYPLTAAARALKVEAVPHPERVAQRRQIELAHLWRSRIIRLNQAAVISRCRISAR